MFQRVADVSEYFTRSGEERTPKKTIDTSDINNIITVSTNQAFENEQYQAFQVIRYDMEVWKSKTVIPKLKDILDKYIQRANIIKKFLQDLTNIEDLDFNVGIAKEILTNHLNALQKNIDLYRDSWLERSLTLNAKQLLPSIWIHIENEDTAVLAKKSLTDALYVFNHSGLSEKLPMKDIVEVLNLFSNKGMDSSAGDELCKRICVEVSRRVIADEVKEFDSDVEYIEESKSAKTDGWLATIINANLEDKKKAFIKIYTALRDGQTGFLKTNFLEGREVLEGREFIQEVLNHVSLFPNGREAKAWDLTRRFYKECTTNNIAMMSDIYKWSFDNSSFFSQSKVFGTTFFTSASVSALQLTAEKLSAGSERENTRTGKICRAIGR